MGKIKMKKITNSRCPCHRIWFSIPIALLSVGVLVLVISALFISASVMTSKLFTNEGHLVDFTQRQFYIIVSFALISISAVTLGISTVWIRYRAIVITFGILILLPAIAFLTVGARLDDITKASEGGLKPICTSAGSGSANFDKMLKPFIAESDNYINP